MPMALGSVPSTKKKSYGHSAWELDPKGPGIQSQPQLHSELRPAWTTWNPVSKPTTTTYDRN